MNRLSSLKTIALVFLLGVGALPLAARADAPRPLQVHGYHYDGYRGHLPLRHHGFQYRRYAPGYSYFGYRYRLEYPWYHRRHHHHRAYRHDWRRDGHRAHRPHARQHGGGRFDRRR